MRYTFGRSFWCAGSDRLIEGRDAKYRSRCLVLVGGEEARVAEKQVAGRCQDVCGSVGAVR